MSFDLGILLQYWPLFLEGAWLTVRISFVAFLLGAIVASIGGKCGSCSKRNDDDARVVL